MCDMEGIFILPTSQHLESRWNLHSSCLPYHTLVMFYYWLFSRQCMKLRYAKQTGTNFLCLFTCYINLTMVAVLALCWEQASKAETDKAVNFCRSIKYDFNRLYRWGYKSWENIPLTHIQCRVLYLTILGF